MRHGNVDRRDDHERAGKCVNAVDRHRSHDSCWVEQNKDWTLSIISKKQSVSTRWNTRVLLTELCSS